MECYHSVHVENNQNSFYPDPSAGGKIRLAPMPDSFDFDRGLLLSVQAIQVQFLLFRVTIFICVVIVIVVILLPSSSSPSCFWFNSLLICLFRHCWRTRVFQLLLEQVTFKLDLKFCLSTDCRILLFNYYIYYIYYLIRGSKWVRKNKFGTQNGQYSWLRGDLSRELLQA